MSNKNYKQALLERRKKRVRKKIFGTPELPRLSVRRSLKHIYAQLIDDVNGRTLAHASSIAMKIPGANIQAASQVGEQLAKQAKEKSISQAKFDRSGRLYHGRVKALAEAARKEGLTI
jgi:large subunit ribosomal protein L18